MRLEFLRYFACAAAALLLDSALFLLLLQFGAGTAPAAAVGFLAGLAFMYWFSTRLVFHHRRLRSRRLEFAGFALIGLLGLALTEAALLLLIHQLGWAPAKAKFATAGLVFLFNFGLRKAMLFTPTRS